MHLTWIGRKLRPQCWLLSCLVVLNFCGRSVATTIVMIRTPDELVVAADSRAIFEGGGHPIQVKSACKIFQVDDSVFALSGFVSDDLTRFSVAEIVATKLRGDGKLGEKIDALKSALIAAMLDEIPLVKQRDSDEFRNRILGRGTISVLIGTKEAGVPVATAFSIGFSEAADGTMQPSFTRLNCPGDCPTGIMLMKGGQTEAIERRVQSSGKNGSTVDVARDLVQLEIDAGALGVGGPIDVVRLTTSGLALVQTKENCPITFGGP